MTDDEKVDFYLKHRSVIEEWVTLRPAAAAALHEALSIRLAHIQADPDAAAVKIARQALTSTKAYAQVEVVAEPRVWVELHWDPRSLFVPGPLCWPHLILCTRATADVRAAILSATGLVARERGLTQDGGLPEPWLRRGPVEPETDPVDLDAYAHSCFTRLRQMWDAMRGPVGAALASSA